MDKINDGMLVVADICNTLFDSNTTFDFVHYCVRTKKVKRRIFFYRLFVQKTSPFFWIAAALQKFTRRDYHKSFAVSIFKGTAVSVVAEWAHSFYNDFLVHRSIPQTIDILNSYRHDHVILASSTIEPVANIIAAQLGIEEFVAAKLEIKDGKYTGKIMEELSGRKLQALKKKLGRTDLELDVVLTDNFSDQELMLISSKKYAICYNRHQENFWKRVPGIHILNISN